MDSAGNRATHSWRSAQNHGRELMPTIIRSLSDLSLAATDITHIAVALGPGGFSAVRVGISAALGLAVSKQLPTLGVPTHDLEVEPHTSMIEPDRPVYSLIPAGRNEISWIRHSVEVDQSSGIHAPDELAALLEPGALLCGEACDLIAGLVDQTRFLDHKPPTRDPDALLNIASRKFDSGISTPYAQLRPIYARPPSISKPKTIK